MRKIGKAKGKPFAAAKGKALKPDAPKKGMSGGKAPNMKGLTSTALPIGSAYKMTPSKGS